MTRSRFTLAALAVLAIALLALAGCGGKDEQAAAQAESAAPAQEAAQEAAPAAEAATEHAADAAGEAAEAVAVHDCAGGCGMTAVPEAEMTEVDGKWYCAGCAKNAQEHAGHGHG